MALKLWREKFNGTFQPGIRIDPKQNNNFFLKVILIMDTNMKFEKFYRKFLKYSILKARVEKDFPSNIAFNTWTRWNNSCRVQT